MFVCVCTRTVCSRLAPEQGCIELGRPERVLPLLQILSAAELNRTVRNYAASTLLNVTALEESRVSLGKDASVLLALLDSVNKVRLVSTRCGVLCGVCVCSCVSVLMCRMCSQVRL